MAVLELRLTIPCLLLALAPVACTNDSDPDPQDEATQMCLDTYAAANGYGFESDNQDDCAQPPGGGVDCPPVTPESVAQECAEDGQTCDPDAFITRDAARCLAEAEGLEPGIAEWTLSLVYNYEHRRPIWVVENTTKIETCGDLGDVSGEWLSFDAETGESLGRGGWSAIAC